MKKLTNYYIAIATFLLLYFFSGYDLLSASAVAIFAYWSSALLIRANDSIPIKELFLSLYALQYLFGSAIAYNGGDDYNLYQYQMAVDSDQYFTYVIPVFLSFALGFNIFVKKNSIKINRNLIDQWLNFYPRAPYYFIAIGFLISFLLGFIPSSLQFIIYIISSFKFVGLFILLMSFRAIKPILMAVIYGSILISSFQGGMFHDLFIWLIMLALVLSYRFKPSWKFKIIGVLSFTVFVIFIQLIKSGLREEIWFGNKDASLSIVQNVSNDASQNNDGLFSMSNIGPNLIRINQGFFLSSVMFTVPKNVAHTDGALFLEYFYAAFVPRIFDADKLKSGGHELTNKYAGLETGGETSMALGLFSDAYIDFGNLGAIFCVFLIGMMYGYILKQFYEKSAQFPILILFVFQTFIYPIRPDNETQTALGHTFKTIILLWILFKLYPKFFKMPSTNKSVQSF